MFQEKEKILLIASVLWFLGEGMFGPLFSVFCENIGGNVLDITWAWSAYLITMGVFVLLVGHISDKVSKEWLLVNGYVLATVFTFLYTLVSTTNHLLLVQIGLGIAAALTIPTWEALYAKYENKKRDGYTWGLAEGMNKMTNGIAILIGGSIVAYSSFDTLFIMMGFVQAGATIYLIKIIKAKDGKRRTR